MTEPLDPERFHIMKPKTKKIILILSAVFIFLVLPFLVRAYYGVALRRPSQSGKEVNFEIRKGVSVSEVGKSLLSAGAINSEFLFNTYVYTNKLGQNIQAGTYKIPAGSNLIEVVEIIQHGTNDTKLTFLEGWRVEEFARLASSKLENIDYQAFVEIAKNSEGYLFPDTYFINKDIQEDELLNVFKENFAAQTANILTEEKLKTAGLTKEEAIIFASMVEREIHTPAERPVVAGILIKRWKEGMLLDVDATTQYVAAWKYICGDYLRCSPTYDKIKSYEWWPSDLSQNDLDADSPYNTRKNVGLPPAPISNPGLSAITAVINHQSSPYYYYLTDREGNIHYAVTLAEHNANVQKYIQ